MIYTGNELNNLPLNVLGVSHERKFLKPEAVEITSKTDHGNGLGRADAMTCISLTYKPQQSPVKTIFEFGQFEQNARVEIVVYFSETEKNTIIIQNPVGSVVDYHATSPIRMVIRYAADQRATLLAVGLAKVSKLERWISQQPKVFQAYKTLKKLSQYALKSVDYIKTNGIDRHLFRKARTKLKALISQRVDFYDPFHRVFGYNKKWSKPTTLRRVAVGCSSGGNFFMQEIADLIACGLQELGIAVHQFDQHQLPDATAYDIVFIVAPHEFFNIGGKKDALKQLKKAPRLFMLNTEQPQTTWFASALGYLKSADTILDMSYQSALRLVVNGLNAQFFPLGYSQSYYDRFKPMPLARTGPMEGLPDSIRNYPVGDFCDRPIDILFVGTVSARRKHFFASNAAFFSNKEVFIYMPSGSDPFEPGSPATIGFQDLLGLARRSKIILNIHRDPDQYLEWQRIVNIGIYSGAIVVSETCDSNPVLQPTYHYIDTPLSNMLETLDHILADPVFFVKTVDQARMQLTQSLPISRTLNLLLSE